MEHAARFDTLADVEASLEEIEWLPPDAAELEAMQKAQRRNDEDAVADQRRQDRLEVAFALCPPNARRSLLRDSCPAPPWQAV